jgi:signal peptidase II
MSRLFFIFITLLDQISKIWTLDFFKNYPHSHYSITPFFNLTLAHNKGITFGLFQMERPWFLITFALLGCIYIFYLLINHRTKLEFYAYSMILGGALGNIIDRIRLGAVVDFLDFHALGYHWYTFNVADACIVIGFGIIMIKEVFLKNSTHLVR